MLRAPNCTRLTHWLLGAIILIASGMLCFGLRTLIQLGEVDELEHDCFRSLMSAELMDHSLSLLEHSIVQRQQAGMAGGSVNASATAALERAMTELSAATKGKRAPLVQSLEKEMLRWTREYYDASDSSSEGLKERGSQLAHSIHVALRGIIESEKQQLQSLEEKEEGLIADAKWHLGAWGTAALILLSALALIIVRSANWLFASNEKLKTQVDETYRAAEEVRALQQQQSVVLTSIAEGILWVDRDRRIIFSNPAAERILGWNEGELIGCDAHVTVHQPESEGAGAAQGDCLVCHGWEGAAFRRVDHEVFYRKDGTSFPVEYTSTPIRNEAGEITGTIMVFSDITDRKSADEAYRQIAAQLDAERMRLKDIVNSIPAVVFEYWLDPESERQEFVSGQIEKEIGFTPAEWTATHGFWRTRVHPDDEETAEKYMEAVMAGEEPSAPPIRWVRRDGSIAWGESHIIVVRDASGNAIGLRGVTFNVDARVAAEEALRESEERLVSLMQSASDAIVLTNEEGLIVGWNQSAADIFGFSEEEILGCPIAMLLGRMARFTASQPRSPGSAVECEATRRNGTHFPVELSLSTWVAHGQKFSSYIIRDITERKRIALELEQMNKQLVSASRQAGMAEVASSVLHNVGNVLNSVNVSCSVIEDRVRKSRVASLSKIAELFREHSENLEEFLTKDPAGQKIPSFIAKLSDRLSDEQNSMLGELRLLVHNIAHIKDIVAMQQNYARVTGLAETVPVEDLVEDALRMNTGGLDRHGVELIRRYEEVPPIFVEKHKVLQILVNLIRNAKHACDESDRDEKQIIVEISSHAETVCIAVIDNGVGILPENMTRIFSHGFTTKKDGHGFGLHSAILAASEMGGRLTAHSEGAGMGAKFVLELPLHSAQPTSDPIVS